MENIALKITQQYCTKFKKYGVKRAGATDSIEIHSIGCAQNTASAVRDSMNQYSPGGIVNAIVDAETSGKVIEILPKDNEIWADAGYGNKHSYAIEIAESDSMEYKRNSAEYRITNQERFLADIRRGYNNAVFYTAKKCKEFGFNPQDKLANGLHRVYSHQEANARGLASAHVDPTHIWGKIGKTMDDFRAEVALVMGLTEPTKQATTDRIWLGWTVRESGTRGPRCTNGDGGKAQGKYQFDYRYALVPFMEYCLNYDSGHYAGFKQYIKLGAGNSKLVNNAALATLWGGFCDDYPTEFERLQDTYAYRAYYLEAKKYIKNLFGINMDNHSPAVKGTLFSMAIRSGALVAAQKFGGCEDTTKDADMLGVAYSTYGSQDAGRWTKAGQWGDAVKALQAGTYTEVVTDMTSGGDILPATDQPWLRVGTAWKNGKCVGQADAYHDRDKAERRANEKAAEECRDYYVFDEVGKVLYTAHASGTYIVQAGSFTASKNADNLADRIKAAGYEAIIKGEAGQYKVQCGVFSDRKNADALVAKLNAAGFEAVVK